MQLQYYYYY